jgi:hypothetical protein
VTDRPRLVGWSSLHRKRRRSLTSLRRHASTATPVPGPTGSWPVARLSTCAEALTRAAKTAARSAPCVARACDDRDAFGRATIDQGFPGVAERRSLPCLESYARLAHRSRSGVAAACVSTSRGILLGQCPGPHSPCGSRSATARGCVGPTSAFSRLRTSTRASSVPVASSAVSACARWGDRLPHVSAIRFGGPHAPRKEPSLRALSSRGDVCKPCLWRLCRLPRDVPRARARKCRREGRQDRLHRVRVNDVALENDPRCLPSSESLRPATPFRAPGSGLDRRRGVATAMPAVDDLWLDRALSGPLELDPRSRVRCQRAALLVGLGVARRLLQP